MFGFRIRWFWVLGFGFNSEGSSFQGLLQLPALALQSAARSSWRSRLGCSRKDIVPNVLRDVGERVFQPGAQIGVLWQGLNECVQRFDFLVFCHVDFDSVVLFSREWMRDPLFWFR